MTEKELPKRDEFTEEYLAAEKNGTLRPFDEPPHPETWDDYKFLQPQDSEERAKLGHRYFEYLESISDFTPDGHWLGDVLKVMFRSDVKAAERLVDNFYRTYDLFALQRRPFFKYWLNKRLRERGYHGGLTEYIAEWKAVAIPAVIISLTLPGLKTAKEWEAMYWFYIGIMESLENESFLTELHHLVDQAIRGTVRSEIEYDLTDGATLDQKEVMNISGDDKNFKSTKKQDPERALDWMKTKMETPYVHFGRGIEEESDNLNVDFIAEKILDGIFYEDKLILLCPPGDMPTLAKRLARTEGALYVRRNKLLNQLKKKTALPPKVIAP